MGKYIVIWESKEYGTSWVTLTSAEEVISYCDARFHRSDYLRIICVDSFDDGDARIRTFEHFSEQLLTKF